MFYDLGAVGIIRKLPQTPEAVPGCRVDQVHRSRAQQSLSHIYGYKDNGESSSELGMVFWTDDGTAVHIRRVEVFCAWCANAQAALGRLRV